MILIDAVYINRSGGKILLEYLIKTVFDLKRIEEFYFLLDERLESVLLDKIPLHHRYTIKGSEYKRFSFYKLNKIGFLSVLCFGNVPPPINSTIGKVFVFFHNSLILDSKHKNYSSLTKLFFLLKKNYIRLLSRKNYTWIVQTKHMAELLHVKLGISADVIKILPIYDVSQFSGINKRLEKNNKNFLYVADGVGQKNHSLLLLAWEFIHETKNLQVELNLTVPQEFFDLCNEIDRLKAKGVSILNHGLCDIIKIKKLYADNNYFVMPSLTESFGLPLLEAAAAGCDIIAADLAYVYDVINPSYVFNPNSIEGLIRCIEHSQTSKVQVTSIKVKNEIDNLLKLISENV